LVSRIPVLRSQNKVITFPVGGDTGQRKLDEFEKLIRDAIALLIERGEMKSPRKRPPDPHKQNSKIKPRQRST